MPLQHSRCVETLYQDILETHKTELYLNVICHEALTSLIQRVYFFANEYLTHTFSQSRFVLFCRAFYPFLSMLLENK